MLREISIFGFTISTYWMMFFVGIVWLVIFAWLRAEKYDLTKFQAVLYLVPVGGVGLLGAKLLFVLEHWEYTQNIGLTFGGLNFFGTLFLVPIATASVAPLFKLKRSVAMDFSTQLLLVVFVSMGVGCILVGCCRGIDMGTFRFPAQFVEECARIILFCWILYLDSVGGARQRLYPTFMVVYGSIRFFLEFFKETERIIGVFSLMHIYAIITIVVGYIWITFAKRRTVDVPR